MLSLVPDLVQMDKASFFPSAQQSLAETNSHARFYGRKQTGWLASDLNAQGVVGDASAASAEKGSVLLDHIVDGFLDYIAELQSLPLPPTSSSNRTG